MARPKLNGRGLLLRDLRLALDEVDALKVELRKAKKNVGDLMRKLSIHVQTHRNTRRKSA